MYLKVRMLSRFKNPVGKKVKTKDIKRKLFPENWKEKNKSLAEWVIET